MRYKTFLDANIIMYALGKEHSLKNPCRKSLEMIKEGKIIVVTNTEVLQEILHRYYSIGMPRIAEEAYSAVKTLCVEIYSVTLVELEKAMKLLKEFPSISSRDVIHAATMLNNGIEKILSTDPHFDVIHGIQRIAPERL
ncbi:MAG: type II toxin-antitoxin system VapC family toxin [Nitrospinae bacterium]|nr:type II toxin-antitoxin system VapC family toxin [Nitrospinota bacterium]